MITKEDLQIKLKEADAKVAEAFMQLENDQNDTELIKAHDLAVKNQEDALLAIQQFKEIAKPEIKQNPLQKPIELNPRNLKKQEYMWDRNKKKNWQTAGISILLILISFVGKAQFNNNINPGTIFYTNISGSTTTITSTDTTDIIAVPKGAVGVVGSNIEVTSIINSTLDSTYYMGLRINDMSATIVLDSVRGTQTYNVAEVNDTTVAISFIARGVPSNTHSNSARTKEITHVPSIHSNGFYILEYLKPVGSVNTAKLIPFVGTYAEYFNYGVGH